MKAKDIDEICNACDDAIARATAAEAEVERLRAEVERLRMKAGQQQARCAVFMQAMAQLAREGQKERAQRWIKRADEAATDVRPEDFVTARPATRREVKP